MKRLILTGFAACALFAMQARELQISSIEKVAGVDNVMQACISGNGNAVVVNDLTTPALRRVDLTTGLTTAITDNGSMLDLKMNGDATTVVYRQRTIDATKRSHTSLQAFDVAKNTTTEIVAPSRNLEGFALSADGAVAAAESGHLRTKSLNANAQAPKAVVGINRGHLQVTVDGITATIDPQGKGSYLWPTISPDGTKIAYYKVSEGTFVCNLDGSDNQRIGWLLAPQWLGNDMLVGMQSEDDGFVVTASAVVAVDMQGNEQTLTPKEMIAVYPSASADCSKIAFSDAEGALYIINIK